MAEDVCPELEVVALGGKTVDRGVLRSGVVYQDMKRVLLAVTV